MRKLWNTISLIGHKKIHDPNDIRELTLLNRIITIGILNLTTFIPVAFYFQLPIVAFYVSCGILLSLSSLIMNHLGYFKFSRISFMIVSLCFITAILLISGKDAGSQIAFILLAVLYMILFKTNKLALPILFITLTVFTLSCYWVETHPSPLDGVDVSIKRFSFYMNVISIMTLVFAGMYYFKNTAREFEEKIIHQNAEISEYNKDITDSINYARRIQQAILPPDKLIKEWLPESFIFYKPKDILAGDFYWLHKDQDKLFFAIADCTGHGVPGAMVSVLCSNALNKVVKEMHVKKPSEILDHTSEILEGYFSRSEEEMKDGMDIAFCCLDLKQKTVEFALANNPLYHVRAGVLQEVKPDKQPIGKHDGRKPFTNHSITLSEGDSIYLFSDGYADQFGGPKGKKFKYSQLKETIIAQQHLTMNEQQRSLENTLQQWMGALEQVDDICVMGIRV